MLVQAYAAEGCLISISGHQIRLDSGEEVRCIGICRNHHPQRTVQAHGKQTHDGFCIGTQIFPFHMNGEKLFGGNGHKFVYFPDGSKRNLVLAHTDSSSFISLYNSQKMRYNNQKQVT